LFGPILPVVPYDSMEEALDYVNRRPRPLSLYLFTYDRALQEHVTTHTHSGSMCINEALIQAGVDDLPFGGIGHSGMGHYHGREGFLTMSKAKSVMSKGRLNSMRLMYPPYGGIIQKWLVKWLVR
jgi:coniferyl-aldehyde dehydrogenase